MANKIHLRINHQAKDVLDESELMKILDEAKYNIGEKVTYEYEAQGSVWETSGIITKRAVDPTTSEIYYIVNDTVTRMESDITGRETYEKRQL